MAQIKGIIVNDGGAPARIMNFIAAAALSAGDALHMDSDGKAGKCDDNDEPIAGYALTDAAAGAPVSMVTGGGLMLYVNVDNVATGVLLMADEATPGQLTTLAEGSNNVGVAVTLENNSGAGLTKVLVF